MPDARPTLGVLLCLACSGGGALRADRAPDGSAREEILGRVTSTMDRSVDPCRDFYRYACGGWLDATERPAAQARWVRGLSTLAERSREVVHELLEAAASAPGPEGTDRHRIGQFYASCLDTETIDARGATPLAPLLARIAAIDGPAELLAATADLHRQGVAALFSFETLPDFETPGRAVGVLAPGGLGLTDRDDYLANESRRRALRSEYRRHVARMLELAGTGARSARRQASRVVAFETELARASRPRTGWSESEGSDSRIDRAGLEALAPGLPWPRYFESAGRADLTELVVATRGYFEALDRFVADTPIETLRYYLRWTVLDATAGSLSTPFVEAGLQFEERTLGSRRRIEPRWRRCVAATNEALGAPVGRRYVERELSAASKEAALELIGDVEGAFETSLPGLPWLDETTAARAVAKARKISTKVGSPDPGRGDADFPIDPHRYFENVLAAKAFAWDRRLAEIGGPVDRDAWLTDPQRVLAYYDALANEIVVPAGILQPPLFHGDQPAAMNYGALGAVVGHELTHAFDGEGRGSDGDGAAGDWWEPEAAAGYETATRCVADQYSRFEVAPGIAVDGRRTLAENVADLGGLRQALLAYRGRRARHGAAEPPLAGLDDEQLFFVAWAQTWCTLATPEYLRRQAASDRHAPARFRAIGPLMSSPEFRDAFHCESGAPMVASPLCKVW